MPVLSAATGSPGETQALGGALSHHLIIGDVLILTGDLGAGKTCLVQGLAAGLGVQDRVVSPTFTLASQYLGRLPLNHLDVYRLDNIYETIDLDLPEALESTVTVVEWGEQISSVLGDEVLTIELRLGDGDDDRSLRLSSEGESWTQRWSGLEADLKPWNESC